ncbi:MAG: hypothetical protein JNL98_29475 [Bryobacterales bacterium]|nr:hypothetical protein [Bryobacterales bacterium]
MRNRKQQVQSRSGIGEWFGELFTEMPQERRAFLASQPFRGSDRPACPFQSKDGNRTPCNKESGVCSIREYQRVRGSTIVEVAPGSAGSLRAVCPKRFYENQVIFGWIGETVLGHPEPLLAKEIGFLQRTHGPEASSVPEYEDVGRIDHVLVHPSRHSFEWCALEIQAVYFSGRSMGAEFASIREHSGDMIPFPVGNRRPDDRSSGPKRLMPQLQTKVPSLRRWGKKMAVVVDEGLFAFLGRLETVQDVSNCDIAWFVVRFEQIGGAARLVPSKVHLTTLERSVESLTGGTPVTKEQFEARIREKLVPPSTA